MTDEATEPDYFGGVTDSIRDYFGVTIRDLFGVPLEREGRTIITAASIERMGGFGMGGGEGSGPGLEDGEEAGGAGAGGGGGGTVRARPVGVIEISDDGVRVEPVIDFTNVLVTALLALAAWLSLRGRFGS